MIGTNLIKRALGDMKNREESIYGKIHMLPTGIIYPNPSQPRKNFDDDRIYRLAESVMRYGILQPLTVRIAGEGSDDLKAGQENLRSRCYELIAGERRLRAAKIAGLREVPCIIIEADDRRSAELAIMENLQREDLNLFEQAGAIGSLIDVYGLTQEQAARILGMSQSAVANKLRLLKLTAVERRLIVENTLSERHARAVLKLSDPEQRLEILACVLKKDLNVSDTEALVDRYLCADNTKCQPSGKRKLVIKDIRIFYNTLDRAIDTIEKAGIDVAKERREDEDSVEFVIKINKRFEG